MRKKIAILLTLLTAGWLVSAGGVAWALTRRRHAPFPEPAPPGWEQERLATSDEEQIGAWFRDDSGPVVIMLHGNGGSRTDTLKHTGVFADARCALLLVSLRAHGDSSGTRNNFGLSARRDVIAAVSFLEKRCPGRPIFVQGTSLGAAAAIFAGPELQKLVSGYILECPYLDLRSAVAHRTDAYLPFGLGRVASLGLEAVAPLIVPELDEVAPIRVIGGIPTAVPLLVLGGKLDDRARPDEVRALWEKVATHAQLVLFPHGRHESLMASDGDLYRRTVLPFLQR